MFASPGKRFEYLCIDQFHVFIVACVYCILVYFEVTATFFRHHVLLYC